MKVHLFYHFPCSGQRVTLTQPVGGSDLLSAPHG